VDVTEKQQKMSNPDNYFKPGQSGNPKGRPKESWTWSGLLKETLEELDEATGQEKKYAIVKALYKQAVKGNIQAIKEYGDRIDGKALQSMDHTTNGKDLTVTIVDYGHKD